MQQIKQVVHGNAWSNEKQQGKKTQTVRKSPVNNTGKQGCNMEENRNERRQGSIQAKRNKQAKKMKAILQVSKLGACESWDSEMKSKQIATMVAPR